MSSATTVSSVSPKAILRDLENFRQLGSVLYVAAHPDDENTELLTYLARGRNYRTAYLSITRGDGGQNVLGADLGEKLGLARTQELLAARQLDGAHQFFTRAIDYGFSKNYLETLHVWDKDQVLSDVVRVIRTFRPDVMIVRFSPSPGGTHGHHTTATVLAMEAFKLAGDPKAYPEQKLEPWQPKRILWNVSTWQKNKIANEPVMTISTTGKDAVTGETFYDIASKSRAMHKTQGFDQFKLPGANVDQRSEQFQFLGGEQATNDILDGVDTSWNRFPGGAAIDKAVGNIIEKFDSAKPGASVPSLLELRGKLGTLGMASDPVISEKREQIDRIIQECLGLKTQTTILNPEVVPGERMKLQVTASYANPVPGVSVEWSTVSFPGAKQLVKRGIKLKPREPSIFDAEETLPVSAPLTQPYWLRTEGTPGMFHVDQPELIGTAENAPDFPVESVFEVAGQSMLVKDEPVQISTDAAGSQICRRVQVIPPVSLRYTTDVAIMTPGTSKSIEVEVKAARTNTAGTLRLEMPSDWKVEPAEQKFTLSTVGQTAPFTFKITAPQKSSSATIVASAEVNGVRYSNQRQEISYAHLPLQLLQPKAVLKAVSLDLKKGGKTIGYLPGAGDSLPENLQQMGYAVKLIDDAKLASKDEAAKELSGLDAVVLGVRAFNVRTSIGAAMPALLAYVENGGTIIVQYNRPDKLKSEKIAPYELAISADRVTDEKAAITFLAPDSPVLNAPNKLTPADFDGWVQERGLYFPNKWDKEHFTPIIACNDAGEPPTNGALLVARYGKGYYIYTGLSFFRQLPAGVPGAYRLFANMVSIGK